MSLIYLATNLVNSKGYVGQTRRPLWSRRRDHESGYGGALLLWRAIEKYGPDSFEWSVVFADVPDEELDELEIDAIVVHRTLAPNGYNLDTGGGKWTDLQRERIGAANRIALTGRTLSEKHRESIGKGIRLAYAEGRRKPISKEAHKKASETFKRKWQEDEEFKKKMSARVAKGNNKRVIQDVENLVWLYSVGVSILTISKLYECDPSVITRYLVGEGVKIRARGKWAFIKEQREKEMMCR